MNPTRICSLNTCDRRHFARGYCKRHYNAAMRRGEIEPTRQTIQGTLSKRLEFYSRPLGECRIWTGGTTPDGYGKIRHGGSTIGAHRAAYLAARGNIPVGMVVDHVCRNRLCINVDHMRLATTKQNAENLAFTSGRSSSGYRGVSWSSSRRKWHAAVKHNGRTYFAGDHQCKEDAIAAAAELRLSLFTHNDADRHPHAPQGDPNE